LILASAELCSAADRLLALLAIWLRAPMQLLLVVITWWSAVTSAP
jgi:hypothetical protein